MTPLLYFAYGSNLDEAQMRARCPSARLIGVAELANHALCFAGFSPAWGGAVASITHRPGFYTPGVLYSMSAADMRKLDAFEGHPFVYERTRKRITVASGRHVYAFTYVHRGGRFSIGPGPKYLRVIERAYKRHGFAKQPLTIAAWGLT